MMNIQFDHILLEPEQKDLLVKVVEASRNIPRDQRHRFMYIGVMSGSFIQHDGLPGRTMAAYKGDIEILAAADLILLTYSNKGTPLFDVTPLGFKYYEWLKQNEGQAIERVDKEITKHIGSEDFGRRYSLAYQKWSEAETLLWTSDSQQQLTLIGHLCREAAQEFATALVDHYKPVDADEDKAHVVARIRSVLTSQKEKLGGAESALLDALLPYWGTTVDLIQRQEHGGLKEGRPLTWEDGRRVVFQTALVMFEIDRSVMRSGS